MEVVTKKGYKSNKVYDILMTPIVCNKDVTKITIKDGKIFTGQKYYSRADEDMSDFTIGFYEVLYKNILEDSILDNNGYLNNKMFAGDTMNSFNSIANRTPNAGNKTSNRKPQNEWPEYLREYYKQYHCLANFWLIPMELGRTGTKLNYYDSADLFLSKLKDDYKCIIQNYPKYFTSLPTYSDFCDKQFVTMNQEVIKIEKWYTDKTDSESLVFQTMENIKRRARAIAESEYINDLFSYFQAHDLI